MEWLFGKPDPQEQAIAWLIVWCGCVMWFFIIKRFLSWLSSDEKAREKTTNLAKLAITLWRLK